MKRTTMVALAILGAISASNAFAGCGRASRVNFPIPGDHTLARKAFGPSEVAPEAAGKPLDPTGLWLSTVTVSGVTAFQAFEAFTSDGIEILNDNGPTLEGNVCLGMWTSPAKNVINVTHPSWNYDESGNLIGSVVIREQITLLPGGNTYQGSVSVEAFDMSGNSLGIVFQGDLSGKRITG
jgi:hypothetical protein